MFAWSRDWNTLLLFGKNLCIFVFLFCQIWSSMSCILQYIQLRDRFDTMKLKLFIEKSVQGNYFHSPKNDKPTKQAF